MKQFKDEGISKLADLSDDLETVVGRINDLCGDNGGYTSYSGVAKGQKSAVRFIIKTDEIKDSSEKD
jgi:hypothetical protein